MSISINEVKSPRPNLIVSEVDEIGSLKVKSDLPNRSSNFGPGADLLMNSKKISKSPGGGGSSSSKKANIELSELKSLEINMKPIALNNKKPHMEKDTINLNSTSSSENVNEDIPVSIPLKNINAPKVNSTWDGFKKINDTDVQKTVHLEKTMSKEDELREKLIYLRKLENLEKKGINLTKKYNMDCDLKEMKGEYEMIKSEKEKSASIKFQGKMLMAAVSAIEFLNNKFDPLDINLDGWGETVNENIEDYDDVFAELHEKYGGKTKMAPELKLLFMLGGSAAMLHMTNTMFKSAIPGMDDIMKQNPELMKQFTNAAVNSMQKDSPGMSSFMQGVMNNQPPPQRESSTSNDNFMQRSRPDINMARDNEIPQKSKRKEMRGPSNINDILSGIKTKKINVQKDSDSTISISELREMKNDLMPQKSKRKQRTKPISERSVINLNI